MVERNFIFFPPQIEIEIEIEILFLKKFTYFYFLFFLYEKDIAPDGRIHFQPSYKWHELMY